MDTKKESKQISRWSKGFLTWGVLRDLLLSVLVIIVGWKLLNSTFSVNIESISFNDLVSVLLAFFAIALSVAFYFKATDTSNRFYDNSYKFTKEISEILGRIEAGFGEKLQHIDEGYTGLRDKFDRMPFDVQQAKEEEQKEENHIRQQEAERNKIILDLMEKARVADGEKEALLKELESHTQELEHSKYELRRLQRKINLVETDISDISEGFIEYLATKIDGRLSPRYMEASTSMLSRRFNRMKSEDLFEQADLSYMEKRGLTNDGKLTSKGARVIKKALQMAV